MPLSGLENLGRRRVLCGRVVALVIVCKIPDVCLVLAGVVGRVLVTGSMFRRHYYTSFVNILAREVLVWSLQGSLDILVTGSICT